jgi:hypothetical protein
MLRVYPTSFMALGTNDPDGGLIVKLQERRSSAVKHHPDRPPFEV